MSWGEKVWSLGSGWPLEEFGDWNLPIVLNNNCVVPIVQLSARVVVPHLHEWEPYCHFRL